MGEGKEKGARLDCFSLPPSFPCVVCSIVG